MSNRFRRTVTLVPRLLIRPIWRRVWFRIETRLQAIIEARLQTIETLPVRIADLDREIRCLGLQIEAGERRIARLETELFGPVVPPSPSEQIALLHLRVDGFRRDLERLATRVDLNLTSILDKLDA